MAINESAVCIPDQESVLSSSADRLNQFEPINSLGNPLVGEPEDIPKSFLIPIFVTQSGNSTNTHDRLRVASQFSTGFIVSRVFS